MQRDDDIDKELRFHLDARVDDLVAAGVAPDEARRRARLEFGGALQVKEAVIDTRGWSIVNGLGQDVRLAVRTLRATPVVTAVAILSLALGIGANTGIFWLVDSLILRALPVFEPQRLVVVNDSRGIAGGFTAGWTYPIWEELQRRADLFDGACAWSTERFNLAPGGGESQPVDGTFASGDFFATLGVQPVLGRLFTPADDVPGGGKDGPVAVISYALWQQRFGGSGEVIGSPLVVERVPFTIVGVTPPGFSGAETGRGVDVALPLQTEPLVRGKDSHISRQRSFYSLTVLLRLRPDQSIESAQAIVRGLQPQIRDAAMPPTLPPVAKASFLKDPLVLVPAASGTSRIRARYQRPLAAIFAVVALVLLIACANIANLQLAKATARRHELSLRRALGAPRWRIVRQWLVESLLLSGAGTASGLLFAAWGSRALVAALQTSVDRVYLDLSPDWRVLAFTAVVAIGTTIVFGTLPALRAARVPPLTALKLNGPGAAGDRRLSLSSGLVIVQVALSLVIIVAAGLFVRTFDNLARLPLGFDRDGLLLANVSVARTHLAGADRLPLFQRLADEAGRVPGVASAAASMITPVAGVGMVDVVRLAGQPPSLEPMNGSKLSERSTYLNMVTPGWFATYRTPLRAGRDFDRRDTKDAPPVIIVNETFVRRFLADRPAVGANVDFEAGNATPITKTVIGVVGDSAYRSLRGDTAPIEYVPLAQFAFGTTPGEITVSVRSATDSPRALARTVAVALTAVDRDLVFRFQLMTDQVGASLIQERVVAILSGFFGALALLLAGLGLFGVTAYGVSRRRSEIGIRMALGAAPTAVVRLVLRRVSLLVAAGVLVGAGVSFWASTLVASMLYGLQPRDPLTLVLAAVVLTFVAGLAAWLPARRASRIDPSETLRAS